MTKSEFIKDLESRGFSRPVTNIARIEVQWLYENGYEVIRKPKCTCSKCTGIKGGLMGDEFYEEEEDAEDED